MSTTTHLNGDTEDAVGWFVELVRFFWDSDKDTDHWDLPTDPKIRTLPEDERLIRTFYPKVQCTSQDVLIERGGRWFSVTIEDILEKYYEECLLGLRPKDKKNRIAKVKATFSLLRETYETRGLICEKGRAR